MLLSLGLLACSGDDDAPPGGTAGTSGAGSGAGGTAGGGGTSGAGGNARIGGKPPAATAWPGRASINFVVDWWA
jgi:hypothetical protein